MGSTFVLLKTLFLTLLLVTAHAQNTNPIKHLIVLMMEKRSFDHLLSYLHLNNPEIDGLKGTEYNLHNASDPSSTKQYVNHNGFDEGPDDPGHGWDDTAEQIYGKKMTKPERNLVPKMDGFVQNAVEKKHSALNPVSMFDNTSAPIINTLAVEFGVFDKWYCSVPGPTDPNRGYFMSGTSDGAITNFNGTLWGQQSYFDFLRRRGISWRAYYQDDPWAIMYYQDMHLAENKQNVGEFTKFFDDIKKGDLAQFTVLQPRLTTNGGPPTWQHPDASVKEGERLYKHVYEALRSSKFWNELAFVLTYDEHGGFYDHVIPPQTGIPSPDGVLASNGFAFDRLGIRVPAVVVSPWVKRSRVIHEPTGPTSTSQYETTSVIATANKIFGIKDSMHNRDAWAGTFENLFLELDKPRDDCPMVLPDIPEYTVEQMERQKALPLNEHLEIQVEFYCRMNNHGEDCGKNIYNQGQASEFIGKEVKIFMSKNLIE